MFFRAFFYAYLTEAPVNVGNAVSAKITHAD